jgi:hypothetical protein
MEIDGRDPLDKKQLFFCASVNLVAHTTISTLLASCFIYDVFMMFSYTVCFTYDVIICSFCFHSANIWCSCFS